MSGDVLFFKQKTADEMRISDWSSDVCSSDLIDEVVRIGTSEIWEISNVSMMAHPFHVHDGQFRILDRNGLPPSVGEQGLKDVVVVAPRERVRILMRFDDYADPNLPYMYHCHILEHEDAGMMGQFVVTH